MTEAEAIAWIEARHGREALGRLKQLVALVIDENSCQNLIAPSTISDIWVRHVLDSAQLLQWDQPGRWLDVGTGGGFPGMVVGLLRSDPVVLVEPRRKRADFLVRVAAYFDLANVTVEQRSVEKVQVSCSVISARAVASVETLLSIARHCATPRTRWLLPRGSTSVNQLADLETQLLTFHVEQSLTMDTSSLLIVEGVGS